ncbi:hypothetical protein [Actinoplanes sp. URMC 104]|uniref:hypothetical protein n=1 Tax=Actinoplanes sp. URMC 104 TaxID=3423409 RepID=UPI003F1AE35D
MRDKVVDTGAEVKDKVLETGADGVGAAGRFGVKAFGRAASVIGKVSGDLGDRAHRRLGGGDPES